MASWWEAESRRGFRGRPGALRARRRFVNLVATLLRFPSLGPEAPRRLSASRHDSHRLQTATPPGSTACWPFVAASGDKKNVSWGRVCKPPCAACRRIRAVARGEG
ncbi:hypothetical protein BPNSA17_04240 [Bordetella petrii]